MANEFLERQKIEEAKTQEEKLTAMFEVVKAIPEQLRAVKIELKIVKKRLADANANIKTLLKAKVK